MTRQTTPDILAAPSAPPDFNLVEVMAAPVAPALRYDYASLGANGEDIRRHALAIKAAERRMGEATVDAGNHLIAVKETIPHGHWLTWLADEFGMSDDAAQVMMNVARRFGSKTESIRYLSPTVLGLLAAKSVPDAAVQAAIEAAAVSPITVTAAKAIIASHRPARCRICHRVLTDQKAAEQGIGACCAARMARGADVAEAKESAQEPDAPTNATPEPSPAPPRCDSGAQVDTRLDALARLETRLGDLIGVVNALAREYGDCTGDWSSATEVRHGLEKMVRTVKRNTGDWEE